MAPAAALKVFGFAGILAGATTTTTFTSAATTTTASDVGCTAQRDACENSDVCNSCKDAVETNPISQAVCDDRYPEAEVFCEAVGASYCCVFDDQADAQACLADQITAEYWDCVLGDFSCGIEDMPCNVDVQGGGTAVPGPTPAPVAEAPSAAAGGSDAEVGSGSPTSSMSSTVGPTSATDQGGNVNAGSATPAPVASVEGGSTSGGGATSSPTTGDRGISIGESTSLSTGSPSTGCGENQIPVVEGGTPSPTAPVRCIDIPTDYQYSSTVDDSTPPPSPASPPSTTSSSGSGIAGSGCGGTPAPATVRDVGGGGSAAPTESVRCIDISTDYQYSSGDDGSLDSMSPTATPTAVPTATPTVDGSAGGTATPTVDGSAGATATPTADSATAATTAPQAGSRGGIGSSSTASSGIESEAPTPSPSLDAAIGVATPSPDGEDGVGTGSETDGALEIVRTSNIVVAGALGALVAARMLV